MPQRASPVGHKYSSAVNYKIFHKFRIKFDMQMATVAAADWVSLPVGYKYSSAAKYWFFHKVNFRTFQAADFNGL